MSTRILIWYEHQGVGAYKIVDAETLEKEKAALEAQGYKVTLSAEFQLDEETDYGSYDSLTEGQEDTR